MKQENTFWFRHFLLCNEMAKKMCAVRGWQCENFAKLILEEHEGKFGNQQMTTYFWAADEFLCLLHGSDIGVVFDEELSIEEMAELSNKEIESYFNEYIVYSGTIRI